MMMTLRKYSTIWILLGILVLIFLSGYGLDYSALNNFSPSMVIDTVKGLLKPDWSYFFDGSGEDVFSLMILTIAIAFVGTLIGTIFAFPLMLLASHNLWSRNTIVPKITKIILDVLRSFPELIYAIIFVKMVGPSPFAGVLAIGVHQIGMLGKLFTEEMEKMNEDAIEAMHSVGANSIQTFFYARLPQVMPAYTSLILNHFEIGVRSAATLGLVGAGGIGAPLIFAIQARNWDKVSIILLVVVVTVFVLDIANGWLRKKLK